MAQCCTLKSFLRDFRLDDDIRYCFILGSGASKQAGIRTGAELVDLWLRELQEDEDFALVSIDPRMTKANRYAFYSQVYKYRFSHDPRKGYQFLRNQMKDKNPSFGHSVLAYLMTNSKHNIAITTNFDALVEDALFLYAHIRPLLIGHESLAGFMAADGSYPVVAKIHRDLLLEPQNTQEETDKLAKEWKTALEKVFGVCTPIVIGYGGNDGSLMGYLQEIKPMPAMYWLYYHKNEPSETVRQVVARHNGVLIPIDGFDEAMFRFAQAADYQYDKMYEDMKKWNQDRLKAFRKRWETFSTAATLAPPGAQPDTAPKVEEISKVGPVKPNTLLDWLRKIEDEPTAEGKDTLFRQALQKHKKSKELFLKYLDFLGDSAERKEETDALWDTVLKQFPEDEDVLTGYLLYAPQAASQALAAACEKISLRHLIEANDRKSLEWRLKAKDMYEQLSPDGLYPSLARSYNNLSTNYADLGDHQAALDWQLKAVEAAERCFPAIQHPVPAVYYNNLAKRYQALNNATQAQHYREKAQAMQAHLDNPAPPG